MLALRIITYSLIIGTLLFLTAAVLPEVDIFKSLGSDIFKWLYFILIAIFFIVTKDKWWVKTVSLLLSLVIAIILIVLFIP
ncbi:hypothetical protein ACFFIX_18600 [Metabacillus herbersteinensis]|uniref:Histidine kinase n=1 Tax=Metabacillus herbersteinensis TaxID=283816 RepID=A0ABV6GJW5_9BACI